MQTMSLVIYNLMKNRIWRKHFHFRSRQCFNTASLIGHSTPAKQRFFSKIGQEMIEILTPELLKPNVILLELNI